MLDKKSLQTIYGYTGTEIYSGYIDDDYNPIWRGRTKIDMVEEMRKSDGTVAAVSDALKTPLLNASWYVETAGQEEQYIEHRDFIDKVLLCDFDFQGFLEEALLYVDYGFYVFEKIYKIKDGMIVWDSLSPRTPKSIESWTITGRDWVDGHPAGITQYVDFTDELKDSDKAKLVKAEIPWEKLIVITYRKTGKNFEGESIFRRAYAHWMIKQKLYKIGAVAAERYGVGTPYFKLKSGATEDTIEKYNTLAKEIRSNERGGVAFTEDVVEQGFMTPTGGSITGMIEELVRHHDKKIYDSVLANFLGLGDQGGSYAMSKDHSSFFLLAINHIAKTFTGVMNRHIAELVRMNYGPQEYYPTLEYSELTTEDVKSTVEGMALAVQNGMIRWTAEDETMLRASYDMPALDQGMDEGQVIEAEEEADQFSAQRNLRLSARLREPDYERSFMKNIADYENYLQSIYATYEQDALVAEEKIRKIMRTAVDAAETIRKDGVIIFAQTPANQKLIRAASKEVDAVAKALHTRWINSPRSKKMFAKTVSFFEKTYADFNQRLGVNRIMLDSNVKGYESNIEALLSNDPRRVKETLEMVLSAGMEKQIVLDSIENMTIINKNTLKLSVVTHPRSAFTSAIYEASEQDGFTFYKVLLPKNKIKTLNPAGMTAKILFSVMTMHQINAWANKETDGKNPGAVQGLNLHHNAEVYFMPVPSDELETQEELSAQQRAGLKETLEIAPAQE